MCIGRASCYWQHKCFASRWDVLDVTRYDALVEHELTQLAMFTSRRVVVTEDRGLGVTRLDVSVTMTDTQP